MPFLDELDPNYVSTRSWSAALPPQGLSPQAPVSAAGRPVWTDPNTGEQFSERTVTVPMDNNKWVTFPSVVGGNTMSEDWVANYLREKGPVDPVTGERFPEFNSQAEAEEYARNRSANLLPPQDTEPTLAETASAAFQEGNIVASWLADERRGIANKVDEDFDLMTQLKADDLLDDVDHFLDVHNPQMYEATKANLMRSRENDRILAASGWTGTGLSFGAALIDLPSLIPGAALARAPYVGYRVGASALRVGAAAAAGAAASEAGLHYTQTHRDGSKTIMAVGGAALLGGLLGAGASKFLSSTEFDGLATRVASDIAADNIDQARGISERVIRAAQEAGPGGADVAIKRTIDELTIAGASAETIGKVVGRLNLSPALRVQTSSSTAAREYITQLVETSLQTNMNRAGETLGTSAEAAVRGYRGLAAAVTTDMDAAYKAARQAGIKMTRKDFNERVAFASRRGDVDPDGNPFVTQAAQRARQTFEEVWERGVEVGAFKESLHRKEYVHRIYDQTKLVMEEPRFKKMLADWLDSVLDTEIDPKTGEMRKQWAEMLGGREDYIKDVVDSAFSKLTGRAFHGADAVPDWVVPITRGPLKGRTLDIPDTYVSPDGVKFEDFLINDMHSIMNRYTRVAGGEIELIRRFGRADMADQRRQVGLDYDKLSAEAKTDAERARLNREREKVMENLEAMRDLVRGTYGRDANASMFGAPTRALLTFNYMTSLGGVALASIPDAAALIGKFGVQAVLRDLLPTLATNIKALKLSVKDVKLGGSAIERVNNHRLLQLTDLMEQNIAQTRYERGLNWMSEKFSFATLLPHWNDYMKSMTGMLSQNRLIDTALKFDEASELDKGWFTQLGLSKSDAQTIRQLVDNGTIVKDGQVWIANTDKWMDALGGPIKDAEVKLKADVDKVNQTFDARRTALENDPKVKRYTKGPKKGQITKEGQRVLNNLERKLEKARKAEVEKTTTRGRDRVVSARRAAREKMLRYQEALATDVDRTIITPGYGDRPLIGHTNLGKLFLQFKSFLMAANQRLLMAGLQGRKLWLAQHIVLGTIFGGMVAWAKIAEREGLDEANKLFDNPGRFAMEGLDRSGTLTYLFEAHNTFSKLSSAPNLVDAASALAGDKGNMKGQLSRFTSRNTLGAVAGPTVGLLDDVRTITDQLITADIKRSGINAAFRQLPGGRLPYVRWYFESELKDQLEEGLVE